MSKYCLNPNYTLLFSTWILVATSDKTPFQKKKKPSAIFPAFQIVTWFYVIFDFQIDQIAWIRLIQIYLDTHRPSFSVEMSHKFPPKYQSTANS